MTRDQAAHYLAGMIDGEGCVPDPRPDLAHKRTKEISISSTDYELIDACVECCQVLNYHHRVRGPHDNGPGRKVYWVIYISKWDTLRRVIVEVPIRHKKKKERLLEVMETYTKRYHLRPLTPEEIADIRISQLTLEECAVKHGISKGRAYDVRNKKRAYALDT